MSLLRSTRTFLSIARRRPLHAWDLLQVRIEGKTGLKLYPLSARRLATRVLELFVTEARPSSLRLYGNYYLDESRLAAEPVVFSVGIGTDTRFDEAVLEAHGARLFLFDPTPTSARYVASKALPGTEFSSIAVTDFDGTIDIFIDDLEADIESTSSVSILNPDHRASGVPVPCRHLRSLMEERGLDTLDVLKMDIEGAAIRVLRRALADGVRPGQIACEFERPESFVDVYVYLRELFELLSELRAAGYSLYRTRDRDEGFQIEVLAVLQN